jgi:hypothetical protein
MKMILNLPRAFGIVFVGAYVFVPTDIVRDAPLAQIYSAEEYKQLDNVGSPLTNYIHVDRVGLIEFPVFPP